MAELCVTIARRRHRVLFEEMKAAARHGVRMVEVRLDYLRKPPRLKEILAHRTCPLIATVRRKEDGGQWRGSEKERVQLLRLCVAEGFDYVDVEHDAAERVPRYGATRRIVSCHNFERIPEDLDDLHARLRDLDADVVKLACMATSPVDNFTMLELVRKATVPTVAVCMGELGTASRVLGAKFGSPFTYAAFNPVRIVAPGMLTFADMRQVYDYEALNEQTGVYGVIGDPISQSLSPLVHNTCFRKLGLNKVYVPFKVPKEALDDFVRALPTAGVQGLSVTIPHKEAIRKFGEDADELCRQVGAANTLVVQDGVNRLYNTDGPAAIGALEAVLPVDPETGKKIAGRTVLILGAGGVARTIAHCLVQKQAIVSVSNRTGQRAAGLARTVGCNTVDWNERHSHRFDIVINCTSVGMVPEVDISPFHPSALDEGTLVFDTVYNPEHTRLIRDAQERVCRTVTGVEMFVRQAEAQFRHFTSVDPPRGLMAELVREELSAGKNMLRAVRLAAGAEP